MNKWFALVIGCVLACVNLSSEPLATTLLKDQICTPSSKWEEVVDYAKQNLPLEGKLIQKSDGFVYVDVDDEYIHTLFPMLNLEEYGYEKPPYFRSKDAVGAHISVFYVNERITPKEIGKTFHFQLDNIVIVKPSKKTSYAILQVKSPELETLRKAYGLSSKLQGHEYHISLAIKEHKKAL